MEKPENLNQNEEIIIRCEDLVVKKPQRFLKILDDQENNLNKYYPDVVISNHEGDNFWEKASVIPEGKENSILKVFNFNPKKELGRDELIRRVLEINPNLRLMEPYEAIIFLDSLNPSYHPEVILTNEGSFEYSQKDYDSDSIYFTSKKEESNEFYELANYYFVEK